MLRLFSRNLINIKDTNLEKLKRLKFEFNNLTVRCKCSEIMAYRVVTEAANVVVAAEGIGGVEFGVET